MAQKKQKQSTSKPRIEERPNTIRCLAFIVVFGCILFICEVLQRIFYLFSQHWQQWVVLTANRLVLSALRIVKTQLIFTGIPSLDPGKTYVVVTNHQSLFDIPIILTIFSSVNIRFVAKKELARWIPAVSFNLRHGQNLIIDRSNPRTALEQIKQFASTLKERKHSIAIFPEGTRSRDGTLGEFRPAGMNALIRQLPDAHIVPMAIDGSWKLGMNGWWGIPENLQVNVAAQPVIKRNPNESSNELVERVLESLRSGVEELQNAN